jgi:hypothetical protein
MYGLAIFILSPFIRLTNVDVPVHKQGDVIVGAAARVGQAHAGALIQGTGLDQQRCRSGDILQIRHTVHKHPATRRSTGSSSSSNSSSDSITLTTFAAISTAVLLATKKAAIC